MANITLNLRWLNTVLRAVSSNSRDGACFKLDKPTRQQKKNNGTQKMISQNLLIKILRCLAEFLLLSYFKLFRYASSYLHKLCRIDLV